MGNSITSSIQGLRVLTGLLYRVLREKIYLNLYGRLTDVQGPFGLTFEEINNFESEFASFTTPWARKYGHRLDVKVDPRFKLTIVGGEEQEVDPDTLVVARSKPDKTPIIVPLDQLNFNCNTVNAVALLIQYFTGTGYLPSRSYMYYLARTNSDMENVVDEGVSFSDVFAVVNMTDPIPDEAQLGYCYTILTKRPKLSLQEAPYVPYVGVQLNPALSNLKTCLDLNGPFVAAISATKDFELYGRYNYNNSDVVLGFQPLLFIKFSEETQSFTAVNSFGSSWGDRGTLKLHVSDLYKDPVFTNSIYTLVPDMNDSDEEKTD